MPDATVLHETLQLTVYSVNYSPYTTLDLHHVTLPTWILSYVQSGDLITQTYDQRWPIGDGMIMLHPPSLPFSEIARRPGVHLWTAFDATLGSHIELFSVYPVYPVVKLLDAANYSRVFNQLRTVWHDPDLVSRPFHLLTLVTTLFDMVLVAWETIGSPPRPITMQSASDRFTEVIRYMTTHLTEKISRQTLAAQVHLHPVYFDQLFRRTYGLPPMQMLRDLRLRHAQKLLQETDFSLAVLADRCGLGDAAYLSRVFQKKFGQTPGAYRKTLKSTTTAYIPALSAPPADLE